MSTLELVKTQRADVLLTMFSIHEHVFYPHKIWATRLKIKKLKKATKKNEQPWILAYNLIFQTMSSLWSSFFGSGLIGSPSKMMSCKLNHNLICLGPRPSSKVLGTNLKLLTNRNAWFHKTLLLAALSKVTLRLAGHCSPRSARHMSAIFVKVLFNYCYFIWKHLPAQKFCRSIEGPFYRSHCRDLEPSYFGLTLLLMWKLLEWVRLVTSTTLWNFTNKHKKDMVFLMIKSMITFTHDIFAYISY
jgi:hypothetical protein